MNRELFIEKCIISPARNKDRRTGTESLRTGDGCGRAIGTETLITTAARIGGMEWVVRGESM